MKNRGLIPLVLALLLGFSGTFGASIAHAAAQTNLVTCTNEISHNASLLKATQTACPKGSLSANWHMLRSDGTITGTTSDAHLRICSSKNFAFSYQLIRSSCLKYQVTSNYSRVVRIPGQPIIESAAATGYSTIELRVKTRENADSPIGYYLVKNLTSGKTAKLALQRGDTLVITGLTGSTSYSFNISAVSVDGQSETSAASRSVTTETDSSANPRINPSALLWTDRVSAGAPGWKQIASSSSGQFMIASAYDGHLYATNDYGVTWDDRTPVDSTPSISQWTSLDVSTSGQKIVAVDFLGTGSQEGIFLSNDYGQTWTIPTRSYSAQYWNYAIMSADGVHLVATDMSNHLYTSNDSGVTWAQSTFSVSYFNIAASSDGHFVLATDSSFVVNASYDYGVTWSPEISTAGLYLQQFALSADGSYVYATSSGFNGEIYSSTDSGVTWAPQTSAGTGFWSSISSSSDGSVVIAATSASFESIAPGHVFVSSDYGATWFEQSSLGEGNWSGVATNNDGTQLAVVNQLGDIYTAMR